MNNNRNKDLAKIHLAKKQLQLDDDTYRDILYTVARVRSAADLDMHGRLAVIRHFNSLGWRAKGFKYPGRPNNTDRDDQLKKIEALLTDMKLPWKYVHGIMQQMGMAQTRIEFLNSDQKAAIITALVKRQQKLMDQK